MSGTTPERLLRLFGLAATIEPGRAASALLARTGARYQEAVQALRAMAERATRRRREQGVA